MQVKTNLYMETFENNFIKTPKKGKKFDDGYYKNDKKKDKKKDYSEERDKKRDYAIE